MLLCFCLLVVFYLVLLRELKLQNYKVEAKVLGFRAFQEVYLQWGSESEFFFPLWLFSINFSLQKKLKKKNVNKRVQYVHACMLSCFSHVQLCVTLWTVASQAPLSIGFSRQGYWSRHTWGNRNSTFNFIWNFLMLS